MSERIKLSVVVPTFNRCQSLQRCLDSLVTQDFRDFEVIIIDGGSGDGTEGMVQEYGKKLHLNFIRQQRKGLIAAMNEGWRAAQGEIILRTDDDIVASPQWISEVIKTFAQSPGTGGVTGPTIIPEADRMKTSIFHFQRRFQQGNPFWKLVGKVYFNYFLEGQVNEVGKWFRSGAYSLGACDETALQRSDCFEVDHHEACNMAVRRELLERIGGFDGRLNRASATYNEPDVSFKIRAMGYKIMFNPGAALTHYPGREGGALRTRGSTYGEALNFIDFYFRHIKPNTVDKFFRFGSYLLFLNAFWVYMGVTTRHTGWLGCLPGTVAGLTRQISRRQP